MKLVSFAVRRYRSITDTSRLVLREGITTLIGPNNEGKSNVLRALVTAVQVASRLDEFTMLRGGRLRAVGLTSGAYDWPTDYPIALQGGSPDGRSEFDLELKLTAAEVQQFKQEVGSSLNGTLPVRISLGRAEPTFVIRKKGPGAAALSAKASKIARFIGRRIELQYVPAVREAAAATHVVERLLSGELGALANDPSYQEAVARIDSLQAPVLAKISATIQETLQVFLPQIKGVQLRVPEQERYKALARSCEIIIDDGTPTSLSRKGDGVQSLAALGLLRYAAQSRTSGANLILAIEEPESHLHPEAIHQIKHVLTELAGHHQVIITTHCPVFVDRSEASANILVEGNRARPAPSVKQIRETLGIRVSDNLVSAEVLLIVEGEDDKRSMTSLLAHHSPKLRKALATGLLGIDSLIGSGKLSYKLTQAQSQMCVLHTLLDADESGRQAANRAQASSLLALKDLTFTSCLGMKQSELEDWYDASLIAPVLQARFGVSASASHHSALNKKWSDRMCELFISSGKPWDDGVELQAKWAVAEAVTISPGKALLASRRTAFDNLVGALEEKVSHR